MTVAAVIDAARGALTPAERRVAEVVLTSPELVAFGTVADLAARANTSGATVVRLAVKLGFDGFSDLQTAIQAELGQRLRPASERIRDAQPSDVLGRSAPSSWTTWPAPWRRHRPSPSIRRWRPWPTMPGRCTSWPARRRVGSG